MRYLLPLFLSVSLVACQNAVSPDTSVLTESEAKIKEKIQEAQKSLTMADYDAIPNGISLEEAQALLGSNGKEMSSSEVAGIKTEIHIWENNPPTSNITLTFQDGKLANKAQFGLK
ncbi:MAG: hypothetical protein J7647_15675 [Cyanobacteria bacterium SBLK]|nr:hypothetical protein [Cyanobacteria bacterium SBLK]